MGAVVGIDLGTTNTVVAAVRNGAPVVFRDETGSALIPSIVSFLPSGAVLVGNTAKERRLDDSKNTVSSIKRLIGRPWDSEEVRQARSRLPFDLKEGPGRATFVVARNETFTLPEISAYVLRKAKSIAELELGEPVDRAVVTVPANFNDLQRAATKVAGKVAGLEILRIINEPTAAALAYGYGQGGSNRLAVFDFGGGTFDVTLLTYANNVFEVLATAGDTFLGGDDFDWAIVERIADAFATKFRYDVHKDRKDVEQLRAVAESIKIKLSDANRAEVNVELVPQGSSTPISLRFAMSRIEFEQLSNPIIDRAINVCREALDSARLNVSNIDHVLAVGGSTRIPNVRRRAEDYFKKKLESRFDPHEVVAIGAALQAQALVDGSATTTAEIPKVPEASAPLFRADAAPEEWRHKTNPFGKLSTTNIGLGPTPGTPGASIQVPRPEGAPSRPVPDTRNLASRARLETTRDKEPDFGLPIVGSTQLRDSDWDKAAPSNTTQRSIEAPPNATEDAESLLPVVTSNTAARVTTKLSAAPTQSRQELDLAEADEDEATVVRRPLGFATIPDVDLPDLPSELDPDSTGPDYSLGQPLDLPAANLGKGATGFGLSDTTSESALRGNADVSARPPTSEELRQRYGDLPLIVGGKKMGASPSLRTPQPNDLPLVRPSADLPETKALLPALQKEGSPSIPQQATSNLPQTRTESLRTSSKAPIESALEGKPALARGLNASAARTGVGSAATRRGVDAGALNLSDADLIDEARSVPPTGGRVSARPKYLEPAEEAALPQPDMPPPIAAAPDMLRTAPGRPPPRATNLESARDAAGNRNPGGVPSNTGSAPEAGIPFNQPGGGAPAARSVQPTALPQRTARTGAGATAPLAIPTMAFGSDLLGSSTVSPYGLGAPPLLIDVTPLSLSVETVGTYCDVLIDRNTPLPCEKTREFVTVQDGQQTVRVRVAQGEARIFSENLLLGELELTGLRPTARGQLRISVTFGLDTDGVLHVRAIDTDTGKAATAELHLAGIPAPGEIAHMASRQLPTA